MYRYRNVRNEKPHNYRVGCDRGVFASRESSVKPVLPSEATFRLHGAILSRCHCSNSFLETALLAVA